jgi:hypothetical protein
MIQKSLLPKNLRHPINRSHTRDKRRKRDMQGHSDRGMRILLILRSKIKERFLSKKHSHPILRDQHR